MSALGNIKVALENTSEGILCVRAIRINLYCCCLYMPLLCIDKNPVKQVFYGVRNLP